MTDRTLPTRNFARLTGLAYLGLAIFGGFAYFSVSETLFFKGDPDSTFAALTAEEGLFRLGYAAYYITLILDVLVAWMLFRLIRPVDEGLARLAAWFRIVYVCVHGAAALELAGVLSVLDGAFAAQGEALQAETAQHHMQAHLDGFLTSLILFGGHLIVLGVVFIRTRIVPRLIGLGLILAATAYIIDGMAFIVLKDYAAFHAATQTVIAIVATIGEVSFLIWLLARGVDYSNASQDKAD